MILLQCTSNMYSIIFGLPVKEPCVKDIDELSHQESRGIYDCVLESLINKEIVESEDFANELFNTDVIMFNNVFTK